MLYAYPIYYTVFTGIQYVYIGILKSLSYYDCMTYIHIQVYIHVFIIHQLNRYKIYIHIYITLKHVVGIQYVFKTSVHARRSCLSSIIDQ